MGFFKLGAAFGAVALVSACAAPVAQEATEAPEPAAVEAAAVEPAPAPEPEPAPASQIVAGGAGVTCGEASWYGDELRGRPTASGEPFVPEGLTAAHRTLPLGTVILVAYEGREVEVRINDRGPFHGDRILDLSKGAADRLGYTDLGAADVCFTIVSGA